MVSSERNVDVGQAPHKTLPRGGERAGQRHREPRSLANVGVALVPVAGFEPASGRKGAGRCGLPCLPFHHTGDGGAAWGPV